MGTQILPLSSREFVTFLILRARSASFKRICPAVSFCPSDLTAPSKSHRPSLCHPEESTCLRQVKSEMNAEIDIDSIGFIFCSLGAANLRMAS
jgi:hypothetical protein